MMELEPESDEKGLIKYKMQLTNERDSIDPIYENASKLLLKEIERIEAGGKINKEEDERKLEFVSVHDDKAIKVTTLVKIPSGHGPGFNYVGKLLGPKGASLKQLQAATMTKMSILGRGSMKDKAKEEELRKEGGKFQHLNDELHVKVEVFASPWDAYSRMSVALAELQKHMTPEMNDAVSMGQREMMYGSQSNGMPPQGGSSRGSMPPVRGGGHTGPGLLSPPRGGGMPSRGGPSRGMSGSGRGSMMGGPAPGGRGGPRGGGGGAAPPRGGPPSRGGPPVRGGPVSRGGPSARGSMPPLRGAGPGRGVPARQAAAPQSYDDYGYESYPPQQTQSYEDPYDELRRHEPVRETPREMYREAPRDNYREAPPREPYREAPAARDTTYDTPYEASSRSSSFYDYGHGTSSADSYTDAYGDRSWDGNKSTPASRASTKSYRSAYSGRPY